MNEFSLFMLASLLELFIALCPVLLDIAAFRALRSIHANNVFVHSVINVVYLSFVVEYITLLESPAAAFTASFQFATCYFTFHQADLSPVGLNRIWIRVVRI
jgi:hypothetical protein